MKLFYTSLAQDLTQHLAQEAQAYARLGKRVFYLAPNSLSFEKERKVLENLENKASFAITVTRFGQLARYLNLRPKAETTTVDPRGLSMVFYRVLTELKPEELRVYGDLGRDKSFIEQLVALYQELQAATLDAADLEGLSEDKLADLNLIFERADALLGDLGLSSLSSLADLHHALAKGNLDQTLADTVLVVDGFTRFSAEEEALLDQLNRRCHEVVIGVYASPKAYRTTYSMGNLYQASLDSLREWAQRFETSPIFLGDETATTPFSELASGVEARYAYAPDQPDLGAVVKERVSLWERLNPKDELEEVARQIRQHLQAGYRYKDVLVLLGDVTAYQLHLKRVFDQYAIPFYLGKAEPMADHPLVQVVDALERLYRYQFRGEDLLNLLTSGLIGQFSQAELDHFAYYVTYTDLKGWQALNRPFKQTDGWFDLPALNRVREKIVQLFEPLTGLKAQSAGQLLQQVLTFFDQAGLRQHLARLAETGSQLEADKHEEVWKQLCQLLEQLQLIFEQEVLTLPELLGLLGAGMLSATYRVVPATRDVVTVKSYNLIEPHTAKLVYALGLTQDHFPELVQNVSLLSDEERQQINAQRGQERGLDITSQDNLKRNHYVFASLLASASDQLVLSSPRSAGEGENLASSYLHLLEELGLPLEQVEPLSLSRDQAADFGHYRGFLSQLVQANQDQLDWEAEDQETATYWAVLVRRLRKHLAKQGLSLPERPTGVTTQPLAEEVLAARYPADKPLSLSASALSDFYDNEYKYFLKHVLRLREGQKHWPDARHHGIFLHRVFELLVRADQNLPFDQRLNVAIQEAKAEPALQDIYQQTAQTRLSQVILEDMLRATATVLEQETAVEVAAVEASFGFDKPYLLELSDGRQVAISGKIDRLDQLRHQDKFGVVDYKSGQRTFDLAAYYNKLSPQLLTYLSALQDAKGFEAFRDVFGAMYLQVHQPQVKLSEVSQAQDILNESLKSLRYKGLFVEDAPLEGPYDKQVFSQAELADLLAYNAALYREAAEAILKGSFAINPYTEDGLTVKGEQFKSITRFEADLHLGQARALAQFQTRGKGRKEAILSAIKDRLSDADLEDKEAVADGKVILLSERRKEKEGED